MQYHSFCDVRDYYCHCQGYRRTVCTWFEVLCQDVSPCQITSPNGTPMELKVTAVSSIGLSKESLEI